MVTFDVQPGANRWTPLLSAITVVELFNAANIFSNSHYKYLEPMTLVGVFFLLVSVPAAYLAMKLEQRFQPKNVGAG